MNKNIVKSKDGRESYEIQYTIHSSVLNTTVYACYRLSAYDGMPIGPLVFIPISQVQ
jgi:hypothetical protein